MCCSLLYCGPLGVFRQPEAYNATNKSEDIQSLFSLLPNITIIGVDCVTPPPFLFTPILLRQGSELNKFKMIAFSNTVSPAAIISSLKGTTVKSLDLQTYGMVSAIDTPLNVSLNSAVCESIEHFTLDSPHNLPVWFLYLRHTLPHLSKLKIFCECHIKLQTWSTFLCSCNFFTSLSITHLCQS